jgi:hypothetical protein
MGRVYCRGMSQPVYHHRGTDKLPQRGQLSQEANAPWFSIFNIIFELVSAYGTVGLSLGVGYDNFS